ncbi:MAG: hypothetical protein DWQ47_01050 [Acidobacteria bacterium]|nr:MAG: hypothetical protein DWQ32_11510 [Acidobacteriota bacterium]REK04090.1 MAG: hypothetical protein DWQ38_01035 [Acidobacteriota bacterium]REK15252.1 MAG: hypothetical protein DWQ43_17200 [Acidobacteriota bacterium]REK46342.1 MAG: hypothetical protein DWQ47_01050 [Acidobacteriota bacterium]
MAFSRKAGVLSVVALLAVVYLGSYLVFRSTNAEVWDKDGQTYVIFPEDSPFLYYAYRPLTYVDGALTGMRFHIGPHR